jgi:hypothetical protein
MSLDYSEIMSPVSFPPPLDGLPTTRFTLGELIETMDANNVVFDDRRGERVWPRILSEGGIAVATVHGDISPKALVMWLLPHDPKDPSSAGI